MGMDPYQRSVQRAGFHAWVVAATAVAAIGMPGAAVAVDEGGAWPGAPLKQVDGVDEYLADVTGAQLAARSAEAWLGELGLGRVDAALGRMLLPREHIAEQAVHEALSAWAASGQPYEAPYRSVAQRQAGHWALTLWERPDDLPGDELGVAPAMFVERDGTMPIALYNPAGDDLNDPASAWWVVPRGYATDAALAPLFNADYHELFAWYDRVVAV